ncbi:MAG: ABC transporter permease [Bacteroides sp.]|jgi:putative ABC transport system permease protein|nr:ABC transporter permease [Bacteroides sp.]MCI1681874.1 ABC transporter permease [Bacteroides sp.]
MIIQHLKRAFNIFKDNPYAGLIAILGTALSITMLMSFFIGNRCHTMNIKPESDRDRTLYVKWVGVKYKENDNLLVNGSLSLKTIQACFRSLKSPEAIVVTSPLQPRLVSVAKSNERRKAYVLFTDDMFWKMFHFKLLSGAPYTREEFEAGIKKVVLGEKLAKTLFGSSAAAIGKNIQLSYVNYSVCAVVEDVSSMADYSFAQAWVPYTSANLAATADPAGVTGKYRCQIFAHSSHDFSVIRKELSKQVEVFNAALGDYYVDFYKQPDSRLIETWRFGPGYPDAKGHLLSSFVLFAILLIIPAINLSGFTMSRMKKRISELGVRRCFGSTRTGLIVQVLLENMIYSVIGGILGLFLSYWVLYLIRDRLISTNYWGLDVGVTIPVETFFNIPTFIAVFSFCLLLNLLSASIPAWRVTSVPIVNSLNNE